MAAAISDRRQHQLNRRQTKAASSASQLEINASA